MEWLHGIASRIRSGQPTRNIELLEGMNALSPLQGPSILVYLSTTRLCPEVYSPDDARLHVFAVSPRGLDDNQQKDSLPPPTKIAVIRVG